jgi:single-strand DNA-binding protein
MGNKNVNKVIVVGVLQKDPNIGKTNNDKIVANLEILTDESYTTTDGKKIEKYERHKIVAWGNQAKYCEGLKKGQEVYIEGKNQTRKTEEGFVSEIVAKEIQ